MNIFLSIVAVIIILFFYLRNKKIKNMPEINNATFPVFSKKQVEQSFNEMTKQETSHNIGRERRFAEFEKLQKNGVKTEEQEWINLVEDSIKADIEKESAVRRYRFMLEANLRVSNCKGTISELQQEWDDLSHAQSIFKSEEIKSRLRKWQNRLKDIEQTDTLPKNESKVYPYPYLEKD